MTNDSIRENNPVTDLEEQDWSEILNSDPGLFWEYLVNLFSQMDDPEIEAQREAFKKSRLQSEVLISQVPNHAAESAVQDIHEILLFFESAANEAKSSQ